MAAASAHIRTLTYESIAEAAKRTGVSTKTIRRRIADGR